MLLAGALHVDDHAAVLFVTSRDAEEDIVAGLDAGADDYMIKPIRRLELRDRALLGRTLVDLLDDAIKFSPVGTVIERRILRRIIRRATMRADQGGLTP